MSQSESLRLDAVTDADRAAAIAWRNDPSIFKWCRQSEPVTADHHFNYWYNANKDPNIKMYAIRVGGELVGICGLTSIDWINRRAEFSLYIGPEHQGKCYGARALRALVKQGFEVHNLNGIWGESFDGNPAIEMFKHVGFKEEGRRRQFYFREGKYVDAILFSLLRSEYAVGDRPSRIGKPGSHKYFDDPENAFCSGFYCVDCNTSLETVWASRLNWEASSKGE